ncbi:GIY-YIG nuclease family protein [Maricaulis alexandrii]|uniref:GIY-YIG nuclease family protein n=1 Tax=Maricaulis alexandrii TaxID=2570354 RepID=UPI00110820FF|nr:GIY-YIG nuclease family protein [Maricaulis alexandrii]
MAHGYYVYMLASQRMGPLYCGVTNDLMRRVYEHKLGQADGFTRKYDVDRLVWFEHHELVNNAITREKRIKRWRRDWKIELIETENPNWDDLYVSLGGVEPRDVVSRFEE